MIVKVFVFLFINSYASFYYLAFIAELVGDCPVQGCMYTLAINVCIVFGSSLASSVFMQIIFPYVGYKYRYFCTNYGSKGDVSGSTSTDSLNSLNQYVDNSVHNQVYHSIGSVVEHNVTVDTSSGGTGGASGSTSSGGKKHLSRPEKEHLLDTVSMFVVLVCCIATAGVWQMRRSILSDLECVLSLALQRTIS